MKVHSEKPEKFFSYPIGIFFRRQHAHTAPRGDKIAADGFVASKKGCCATSTRTSPLLRSHRSKRETGDRV
jgi:hypothetical protein